MLLQNTTERLRGSQRENAGEHIGDQWVRLVPPGITAREVRFDGAIGGHLSTFVDDALRARPALGALEILTYPGAYHQEYLLRPCKLPELPSGQAANWLSERRDLDLLLEKGVDPISAGLAKRAEAHLIGRIGVELVDLDLSPIGSQPGLTTRLVSQTADPVAISEGPSQSSFATYLDSLTRQQIPHLARTIIAPTESKSLLVEQQVATFDRHHRCVEDVDLATILVDESLPKLSEVYDPPALTSNVQLFVDSGWQQRYADRIHPSSSTPDLELAYGSDTVTARRAGKTVGSSLEYDRLLGSLDGLAALRELYEELDVTATIEIDPTQLSTFLGYHPNYDRDLWSESPHPGRWRPKCTRLATLRTPTGCHLETTIDRTGQSRQDTVQSLSVRDFEAVAEPARELAHFAQKRLREYGDSITVAQNQRALPGVAFTRTRPDRADSEPVIVGTKETLHSGTLIAGVSAVQERGGSLTVITETSDDAYWIASELHEPFVATTDTWTTVFPVPGRYWADSESVAVIPREISDMRWQISPTGQTRLVIDDRVIKTGQGDLPSPRETDHAPWAQIDLQEDTYELYYPGGELAAEFDSVDELGAEYQSIPLPAVPRYPTHLDAVTILRRDGDTLIQQPALRLEHNVRNELGELLEAFLKTYTCPLEDQSLSSSEIISEFLRFLRPLIQTPLPIPSSIERQLEELKPSIEPGLSLTTSHLTESPTIKQRTWRYPIAQQPVSAEITDGMAHNLATRLDQTPQ